MQHFRLVCSEAARLRARYGAATVRERLNTQSENALDCDPEDQLKLLGVSPDRKLGTVESFLLTVPELSRATAREVYDDMCEAYASVLKKVLPQARNVAGRFQMATSILGLENQQS